MKTKNFEFIKNLNDKGDILYNLYSEIEENINNINWSFRQKCGIALEGLAKIVLKKPLDKPFLIQQAIEDIRGKQNIPPEIMNSFKTLQLNRNIDSHFFDDGIYKEGTQTINQKINLLRQLFYVSAFMVNEFVDSFDQKAIAFGDFKETPYFENISSNIKEIVEEKGSDKHDDKLILIDKLSIADLLLNKKIFFYIPSYQRSYSWNKEFCEDLIENVLQNGKVNESQFFGSIAIIIEEWKDDNKRIKLIDGQQRITTSLIIFRVIRDLLININQKNLILEDLKDTFGTKAQYKIINDSGNYIEGDALKELIKYDKVPYDEKSQYFKPFKKTNAWKNYTSIFDKLKLLNEEEIEGFYYYYAKKYIFSCIDFKKNREQEMEIFENLNSKGMELSIMDLCKNALFLKIDKKDFEEHEDLIVNLFNKNLNISEYENRLPSEEIEDNKKREIEESFIYTYIVYALKTDKHKRKDRRSMLKFFTQTLSGDNWTINEFEKNINNLGKYFSIFLEVWFGRYKGPDSSLYEFRNYMDVFDKKGALLSLLFYISDLFEKNYDPYIKKIFYKDEKYEKMKNIFFEIEKWSFGVVQYRGGQSSVGATIALTKYIDSIKNRSNYFLELDKYIGKWFGGKVGGFEENDKSIPKISMDFKTPTREEFISSLIEKKLKAPVRKTFLKRIEEYTYNQGNNKKQIEFIDPSIEHIIPQTLSREWKKYLVENSENEYNESNIEEISTNKIDMIGNLLIFDSSENTKISNKIFSDKQRWYKKSNSMSARNINIVDNFNLTNIEVFSLKQLDHRTEALATLLADTIYKYE
ncbi:hypothetical protein ESOMN_v1c03350 [Williamsoniiplasma somnilux]|uniref:DUF262 domain-containing protein n=1 Tax=Williamsoniiplasma somnilux TaxID=215578 RepID=A0A2K8NY53_9MOLU|nr:DUF262 domain-containing protein [Williamsoniiplasma somnilux]ATZ18717.1 hypothetical protein ESOMN_v1c03350 [Williamsoniiplasma somnilux]